MQSSFDKLSKMTMPIFELKSANFIHFVVMSNQRVVVTCIEKFCQVEGEIIFVLSSRRAVIILGNVVD